jgi:hypothetical protein
VERTIAYRLDREDKISDVSAGWGEFARENGAPELAGRTVLGRSIWDFVAGAEARLLWSRLFARCRATRESRRLPYRFERAELPFLTHGLCPACAELVAS